MPFRYFTKDSRPFPPPANTYVIGPCTGGFAATAVSCSHTLPDLVSNGVQTVLAAFRTALRSFLVGQSLSSQGQSTQPNKSWSVALSAQGDVDLDHILKEYSTARVIYTAECNSIEVQTTDCSLDPTSELHALGQCDHGRQNENVKRTPCCAARLHNGQ